MDKRFQEDKPYADRKIFSPKHISPSAAATPVIIEDTQDHPLVEDNEPEKKKLLSDIILFS